MNARSPAIFLVLVLVCVTTPALAHRLDEYLQATTIGLEKTRVTVELRLTPGVAVLPTVLPSIDTDGDGVLSEAEQRAYAEQVLRDVSFTIDGKVAPLRLVSASYPKIEEMKEGLGDIILHCDARLPVGGPDRRLVFENHHQSRVAAYLVNCLFPSDPDIRVTGQNRNYDQSFYQLDYTQAAMRPADQPSRPSWSTRRLWLWLGADGLVLAAWLAIALRRRWRTDLTGNAATDRQPRPG